MAGIIVADTIQSGGDFIRLNSASQTVATINARGIYANTGNLLIASNGTIGVASITNTAITGTMTQAQIGAGVGVTGPSFSVSAGGTGQTIGAGTIAKLTNLGITGTPGTNYWDTNSCWDNTNKRFTPNVAGYYIFSGTMAIAGISSGANIGCEIQKNGGGKTGFRFNNGGVNDAYCNVTVMYYMNGTTDYVEFYAVNLTGGNVSIRGEQSTVWFNGAMIRSA